MPEKSARSHIDGRHFGVNRPIDPMALLFCVWMVSKGCVAESSTLVDCSWLIDGLPCALCNEHFCDYLSLPSMTRLLPSLFDEMNSVFLIPFLETI
jgi:hypothetical protein